MFVGVGLFVCVWVCVCLSSLPSFPSCFFLLPVSQSVSQCHSVIHSLFFSLSQSVGLSVCVCLPPFIEFNWFGMGFLNFPAFCQSTDVPMPCIPQGGQWVEVKDTEKGGKRREECSVQMEKETTRKNTRGGDGCWSSILLVGLVGKQHVFISPSPLSEQLYLSTLSSLLLPYFAPPSFPPPCFLPSPLHSSPFPPIFCYLPLLQNRSNAVLNQEPIPQLVKPGKRGRKGGVISSPNPKPKTTTATKGMQPQKPPRVSHNHAFVHSLRQQQPGTEQDRTLDWTQGSQDSVFSWTRDRKEQKKRGRIEHGSIVVPSTGGSDPTSNRRDTRFPIGIGIFFGCIYGSGSFDGELWTPLWTLITVDHQDRLTTARTLLTPLRRIFRHRQENGALCDLFSGW